MVEFLVTVPGGTGGGYYIDGVQKPIIPVVTGGTFRFNQNAATNNNHPLILSTTTSTAGIISAGVSYYLDGASNATNYRNTSLFNAASVRYIEITVAQTTDFYYICNVHGSGMGNTMDVTFDTWSALSWNAGNWSDQSDITTSLSSFDLNLLQGQAQFVPTDGWGRSTWGALGWNANFANITTNLTGIELKFTLGDETTAGEINSGWGRSTWGASAWGISGTLQATGQQIELSLNNVTTIGEINSGWGRLTWNANAWGIDGTIVFATGNEIDLATGSLSISGNSDFTVTGLPLEFSLGEEEIIIATEIFATGFSLEFSLGEVDPGPDVALTGQQLNLSTGTLSGYNREGWGRFYWGEEVWGSNGTWGTETVTGLQLNIAQGNENTDISITVPVSSNAQVGWGVVGWGTQTWNNSEVNLAMDIAQGEVDPSPDAIVTGIGMNVSLSTGSVIIGTATVDLTGIGLDIGLGTATGEPITLVDITGIGLDIAQGSASGQTLVNVSVTGNGLTISQNSINTQIWTKINTGTVATWIEIDTAA